MAKLVSIIYPTNNRNIGFILDSLSTILYQSYQSWELIVVKDSSFDFEDKCGFIINDYRYKIKFIDAPDNCGVGKARDIGLKNARGSYIAYLDDDDLWSQDYLQNQIDILEKSNADVVYCNYHLRTQIYNDIEKKYVQHFISIPYNVNPFDRNVLLTESFIHPSSVVHTKNVTELIEFPNLRSFSEWDFFLKISKLFRFQANSNVLATIQRRLDNTNSRTELNNESIHIQKRIIQEYDSDIKDEDIRKIRDMVFNTYVQEYEIKGNREAKKLETLLQNRGVEFAFAYLKMLLDRNEINASICKVAYDISLLNNNKDLAEDFQFLTLWYSGQITENYSTYIPKYFERKNEQWNALL
jgi:glycosyltransferase involved in cell wall biosynthesis